MQDKQPVIIIEKNQGNKALLLELLQDMGCRKPLTFTDPEQAFDFFATTGREPLFINAVFLGKTDDQIRMFAVLMQDCLSIKQMPFFLLTANTDEWKENLALHPGALQYHIHPDTFTSMAEAVEDIMGIINVVEITPHP